MRIVRKTDLKTSSYEMTLHSIKGVALLGSSPF